MTTERFYCQTDHYPFSRNWKSMLGQFRKIGPSNIAADINKISERRYYYWAPKVSQPNRNKFLGNGPFTAIQGVTSVTFHAWGTSKSGGWRWPWYGAQVWHPQVIVDSCMIFGHAICTEESVVDLVDLIPKEKSDWMWWFFSDENSSSKNKPRTKLLQCFTYPYPCGLC